MMKPYFETENGVLYHGDCLELMKTLPDNHIDLTVTSPPYNMNLRIRNGEYCSRQGVKEFSTKYKGFGDNLPIEIFYPLHLKILTELVRVSKIVFYNFQIVTGSKRPFFKIIGAMSDHIKDIIVWDKINCQPAMQDSVLNSRVEYILILGDNPISRMFTNSKFKRGKLENIWHIKRGKNIQDHGATFPESLVYNILHNFSNKKNLIFDPFSGSGTTYKVCIDNNRRFIGSELQKEYCELTKKRIKKATAQMRLPGM